MGTLSSLIVKIGADISGFKAGMATVKSGTKEAASEATSNLSKFTAGMTKVGAGAIALGGVVTGAGAAMVAVSEPLERAQVTLEQTIKNTGGSYDALKGRIDSAVQSQEKFGHDQADTEDALGKLTAAFQSPTKALAEMATIQEIAAFKHISLADAAELDIKMHAGAGRSFKEFGINVQDGAKILKAAGEAEKADAAASDALSVAKRKLADVHAELAGKSKLSVSEQIRLRDATLAVKEATLKASSAHQASVAAQAAAKNATADYSKIIHDQLLPRIKGVAEAQSDTFGGKLLGYKTHITDFAASFGQKLGPALVTAGPLILGFGAVVESLGPIVTVASKVHLIAAAQTAAGWVASAATSVASFAVMAAGALVSAAAVAIAWVIAFWPIILIIALVVATGLLLITHWKQVQSVAGTVAKAVGGFFSGMGTAIHGAINGVISWVKTNWPMILAILTGPIGLAVLLITTHFSKIKGLAQGLWNDVRGIFRGLATDIGNIWNGIVHAISSIHIPSPHISVGSSSSVKVGPLSVPVPNFGVSWYGSGAIFTKPTIFGNKGVGENGPEGVLPLKNLGQYLPMTGVEARLEAILRALTPPPSVGTDAHVAALTRAGRRASSLGLAVAQP